MLSTRNRLGSATWLAACTVLGCTEEQGMSDAQAADGEEVVYIDNLGDAVNNDNSTTNGVARASQPLSINYYQRDNQWTYFSWGEAIGDVNCPNEADWYNTSLNGWVAWWYGINDETFVGGKIYAHNHNVLFPASQTRCFGGRHDILMSYGDPAQKLGSQCAGALGCTGYYKKATELACISFPGSGNCTAGVMRIVVDKNKVVEVANSKGVNPDVYELYIWCHEFGHALGLGDSGSTTGPDYTCMVSGASATHINNWWKNGGTTYYKNDEYRYIANNYNSGGGERNCDGTCDPL